MRLPSGAVSSLIEYLLSLMLHVKPSTANLSCCVVCRARGNPRRPTHLAIMHPGVLELRILEHETIAEVDRLEVEIADEQRDVGRLRRVPNELRQLVRLHETVREVEVVVAVVLGVDLLHHRLVHEGDEHVRASCTG